MYAAGTKLLTELYKYSEVRPDGLPEKRWQDLGEIFTVRQVGRAAFPCKTARVFHRKLLGLRFNRRFCSILQLADEVALLHACGGERCGET